MSQRQTVIITDDRGYFIANVPSLPGCMVTGKTMDEALSIAANAIAMYEEALLERGQWFAYDLPMGVPNVQFQQ